MKITGVKLESAKLADLLHFYGEIIGMPVLEMPAGTIMVNAGATSIQFNEAGRDTNPAYHFAFNIPSNKIDEAMDWLQQRVPLLWVEDHKSYIADFVNWHAKSVYFLDPAGNVVEFIARFDLKDEAKDTFSAMQIRNVSELGLVFDAVAYHDAVEKITREFNLSYFDKQPPLSQFRAFGDDEGLFIAVPSNRPWFPTKNVLSSLAPLSVEWQLDGEIYRLKL